jgi:hypothetical protein
MDQHLDQDLHDDGNVTEIDRSDARRDFRLRRTGALTLLLSEREDLRGVHAVADLLDDAVRWTA